MRNSAYRGGAPLPLQSRMAGRRFLPPLRRLPNTAAETSYGGKTNGLAHARLLLPTYRAYCCTGVQPVYVYSVRLYTYYTVYSCTYV